ncbi:unnamed protein product [Protopolystoma xenopodis]|uniref:Uncharacterized protein n=1 Tax=Protopolystoma xenopodis TaxID=117903 RepID=A0A3S5AEN2_9PLAT|nr:unnamed protein product [Protopolystoma xenopodis]
MSVRPAASKRGLLARPIGPERELARLPIAPRSEAVRQIERGCLADENAAKIPIAPAPCESLCSGHLAEDELARGHNPFNNHLPCSRLTTSFRPTSSPRPIELWSFCPMSDQATDTSRSAVSRPQESFVPTTLRNGVCPCESG